MKQIEQLLALEPPRDYAVSQVIHCWSDMSTERSIGMAEGPVPWSAIVRWCEVHELDHEATAIMTHVIRTLDNNRARQKAAEIKQRQALGPAAARGRT